MNKNSIVIIPCYNEEKRLKTEVYLDSLKKLPEISILFVNDGSNDRTLEVLKNIANQLPEQI
ncbi:glycosyltransferase, partial [Kaistella sp.]